jgi:hypothetical protein
MPPPMMMIFPASCFISVNSIGVPLTIQSVPVNFEMVDSQQNLATASRIVGRLNRVKPTLSGSTSPVALTDASLQPIQ